LRIRKRENAPWLNSPNRINRLDPDTRNELERIINQIRQTQDVDDQEWKKAIGTAFSSSGFKVEKRVFVPDRGDGRTGRVAMVYTRADLIVGVEAGRCNPKQNSIPKLNQLGPTAIRLIGLRSGRFNGSISGVDRIFSRF
jgi:hypothetical protein